MSIKYKILGKPGRDNALFVWLNSGTRMYRILFDCGENIFNGLKQPDVKSIDYLFLSHLHIDHIAGFDYYFRRNFDREKPNLIWAPENSSEILHNRLKGFKWNLISDTSGEFIVTEISRDELTSYRFITSEGFANKHSLSIETFNNILIDSPDFAIKAAILNHSIQSVGYSVLEKESFNISKDEFLKSGLTPGKWLEKVRDLSIDDQQLIEVDNEKFLLKELRNNLLRTTKGESISYLTDFIYDDQSISNAIKIIKGTDTLVCESQYHSDDKELAEANYHLTAAQAAELAKDAGVKKLVLFHISERYRHNNLAVKLLKEARTIFPETYLPDMWGYTFDDLTKFGK